MLTAKLTRSVTWHWKFLVYCLLC